MDINLIACVAQNGAIGRGKELLFYFKEDMERFRKLTTGNTIIMGRKTFDSLPHGALPNRNNIVISSQKLQFNNCYVCQSLQDAILLAKKLNREIFIIGGASIYEQTISIANRLYLTKVEANRKDADIFFPHIDLKDWRITEEIRQECMDTITKETLQLSFITYEKL